MQIDPGEAERGRNQDRGRSSIRPKGLAVQRQFRVKMRGSPTLKDRPYGCLIHAQQVGERFEIRGQRYDRAHIEVTIRPAIETVSNARRQGIIYRRVAQRALDSC